VTIPDYVAIGLLAVCLMLWAGTVLLARKSRLARGSRQDATERQGLKITTTSAMHDELGVGLFDGPRRREPLRQVIRRRYGLLSPLHWGIA
jgi:hypothetical protein